MANIHIRHAHTLTQDDARNALTELAESLQRKLAVETHWQDDALHFSRSGVDGSIRLLPGEVEILAKLGMFLAPMKGMVEQEINRVLKERF